jgi:zinc transport system substrate-binding protein
LQVTVSILPQQYVVSRIGGEAVTVNVMVGPGESPATYEPKPSQLKALAAADAYIRMGVPFEDAWWNRLHKVNPAMRVVDANQGIERLELGDHDHGHDPHHAHTLDPHTWLSPRMVKQQVETVCRALSELAPDQAGAFRANADRLLADIDSLDQELSALFADLKGSRFLVFHPSWAYFARDYGLEQIPVEVGGQEPSAAELANMLSEARELGVKAIFAQPEFSTKQAEAIARELNCEVILVSPLAADWLTNLSQVGAAFAEALR